jgi:hypothetical protein
MATIAIKILLWAALAFPLWVILSDALLELGIPLPRLFGAVLGWVAAGFILGWALPLFGHHLGLPWAFAHP